MIIVIVYVDTNRFHFFTIISQSGEVALVDLQIRPLGYAMLSKKTTVVCRCLNIHAVCLHFIAPKITASRLQHMVIWMLMQITPWSNQCSLPT